MVGKFLLLNVHGEAELTNKKQIHKYQQTVCWAIEIKMKEVNKAISPLENTPLHQYSYNCPGIPLISEQGGLLGHGFRKVTLANLQIVLLSSVFTEEDIKKKICIKFSSPLA